ncbi:MAG: MBL fold metallo-hydrolase, partial [Clostridia bacterium]|nr:MBL fold metallo-hydrolase [Clostridia bacterium]
KTERFLSDRVLNICHYVGVEYEPIKPDKIFKDGDILDFCGNSIRVIHTPGHTEDSVCLLCGNTLISGDTLFRRSIGRWDHPTGDMKQEMDSIKNKLMTLPDDTLVYPGHGAPTTIGEERRENPYVE